MSKQSEYQKYFPELIHESIVDKLMYLKDVAKVMNVNYDTLNKWLKVDSKYDKLDISKNI